MEGLARVERDLEDMKAALLRIEERLDKKSEKVDDRLRVLESRMAQVWVLGILATLIVAPLISLVIRKMGI
jgi:glutathione S-transferase